MSERERDIMTELFELIPKLDDFHRGRLLGRAEGIAEQKERQRELAKQADAAKDSEGEE